MVPLGLAAMKKHHAIVTLIMNILLEKNKVSKKQLKVAFLYLVGLSEHYQVSQ